MAAVRGLRPRPHSEARLDRNATAVRELRTTNTADCGLGAFRLLALDIAVTVSHLTWLPKDASWQIEKHTARFRYRAGKSSAHLAG